MKKYGVREVQVNLTKLLREVPFAITKYDKVIAVVDHPGANKSPKEANYELPTEKKLEKIIRNFPGVCVHGAGEKMCRVANCKHYYAKK